MQFEAGDIYHIYNQGNNRQKIFFNQENYYFFLKKLGDYILPYADILAWCLMPNHFHLMVYVHSVSVPVSIDGVTQSHPVNNKKERVFNDSIAILLRSYTRAVNKQEDRTGCLFREETKAECITKPNLSYKPTFFNTGYGTEIIVSNAEKEYPQICFNYIHQNPVKAGLVKKPEDWEFSSYRDVSGLRNGKLINRDRIKEFELNLYSRGDLKSPRE